MACLLLVALACTGNDDAAHDEDEHTTPIEAPTDTVFEQAFPLGEGQVAEAGLPALTVHEDVTIETVSVNAVSGTVELLTTGLSHEPVAPRCWNAGASFMSRGISPAKGAVVARGERPYLILYLRGAGVVDQVVVRYVHEDEHTELRWNAVKLDLTAGPKAKCLGG